MFASICGTLKRTDVSEKLQPIFFFDKRGSFMKERKIEKVISGILVGILIILTIFMIADVKKLQGNARVVNYAGIIR